MENMNLFSISIDNNLEKYYQNYLEFYSFYKKHNLGNFAEFSYHVLNESSLFITEPDLDFEALEIKLNKINKVIPAAIRIFRKPLLHLKEESVIMPVEAVKKIDHDTLKHMGLHSELWDDIKDNKISPKKLLTRIYQDNYGIYENLIFCNTIDKILSFLKYNMRLLRDLIHTKQTIELNLLERLHHLQYFQALGKLYTGYIKFFDQFYDISYELLKEMNSIFKKITGHLRFPVYQKNLKRPKYLKLRKTNILGMHKDYKQIYALMKSFNQEKIVVDEKTTQNSDEEKIFMEANNNYYYFCQTLMIFSLNHFNFTFLENQIIDLDFLMLRGSFKKWNLSIESKLIEDYHVIELELYKQKNYKIVFIPIINNNFEINRAEINGKIIDNIALKIEADEYIILTPLETDEYCNNECYISILDIESFRRIQQFILRGMVLTDTERLDCPFCKNSLEVNHELSYSNHKVYECRHCRTMVVDTVCLDTDKKYSYTMISNLESKFLSNKELDQDGDLRIFNKKVEAQIFFRNITKLNSNMEMICPYCNKTHRYY